jgi:hypothetical protein
MEVFELWFHEFERVFKDKLGTLEDQNIFNGLMDKIINEDFSPNIMIQKKSEIIFLPY